MGGKNVGNRAPRRANRRVLAGGETSESESEGAKLEFSVSPEAWRFVAYSSFAAMVMVAYMVSRTITADVLARGPETPGDTCGPFNNGTGFDFYTDNHLIRAFGYANICVNWDYSPSREVTAMVYPAFEYALLFYIVLDYLNVALGYQRGYVGKKFWILTNVLFPLECVLCAWFRMIFVVVAYENLAGHTAGFMGLQIVLILLSIQNTGYVLTTGTSFKLVGGLRNTQIIAVCYIVGNLIASAIKLVFTATIVFTGAGHEMSSRTIQGIVVGKVVDAVWMLFNVICPFILSFVRARSEKPLIFTIDMQAPKFLADADTNEDGDGDEEGTGTA